MKAAFALALRFCLLCLWLAAIAQAQNWPSFRGPQASGVASGKSLPAAWDGEKSINILWKTPIPGLAHSSPIIWGNRVFITTAVRHDGDTAFRTNTDDNAPVKE